MDKYGVMMTPTVIVEDEIAVVGKVPSEKKPVDKCVPVVFRKVYT